MYTKENLATKTEYAKAYVKPQRYENLLPLATSLKLGTIFKDLYRPYVENEK